MELLGGQDIGDVARSGSPAEQLVDVYRKSVRPQLASRDPGAVRRLDLLASQLLDEAQKRRNFQICVVGESQVGKSTLLNALFKRRLLPAGGTGPLTARDIRITPALHDSFDVRYHDVDSLRAVIERIELEGGAESALLLDRLYTVFCSGLLGVEGVADARLIKLARSVVGDAQELSRALDPFSARIRQIRAVLGKRETVTLASLRSDRAFGEQLRIRTTGWPAPLIADLHLHLRIPGLDHIEFTDLPGVGTVADSARLDAHHRLQARWDFLLVVVRNCGLTEASVKALLHTGVLADVAQGDTKRLAIVVTHLDDVSRERLLESRDCGAHDGADALAILRDLVPQSQHQVRGQLASLMCRSFDLARSDASAIADDVPVIAASAPDFIRLMHGQTDGLFITSIRATGIPELERLVKTRASAHAVALEQKVSPMAEAFRASLGGCLAVGAAEPLLAGSLSAAGSSGSAVQAVRAIEDEIACAEKHRNGGSDMLDWCRLSLELHVWAVTSEGAQTLIPELPRARMRLASALAHEGRHGEAFEQLEEALEGMERLERAGHAVSRLARLNARLARARTLFRLYHFDEAHEEARQLYVVCSRGAKRSTDYEELRDEAEELRDDIRAAASMRSGGIGDVDETVRVMLNALDLVAHSRAVEYEVEVSAADVPTVPHWVYTELAENPSQALELARREFEHNHKLPDATFRMTARSRAGKHEPEMSALMTINNDDRARRLVEFYRATLRPVFEQHDVQYFSSLDSASEIIERTVATPATLALGFVGESQVGKSTLINALLERRALPSGGVGPLTANEVRVEYGEEDSFSASYHGRQQLNQVLMPLNAHLARRSAMGETSDEAEPAPDDEAPKRADYMLDQARKMLTEEIELAASEAASDELVVECLRYVVKAQLEQLPDEVQPFAERIAQLREKLGRTEAITVSEAGSKKAFGRALKLRAAKWLAPLVSRFQLRLRTEMLRSISLVDLPGIGVFADAAGQVASDFVRKEGDALLLVMTNKGMPEVLAHMLEETGVITKLLFGSSTTHKPIQVVLAVTHLDDVAKSEYERLADEADEDEDDGPLPERKAIFEDLSNRMAVKVRRQLRETLSRAEVFDELPDDTRGRRQEIIDELCDELRVFCVAAPDYLSIQGGRGLEFLRDADSTAIPSLRSYLIGLAEDHRATRAEKLRTSVDSLGASAMAQLDALIGRYRDIDTSISEDWGRYADRVRAAVQPLREEMSAYHGSVVTYLGQTMPAQLQLVCSTAGKLARRKLDRIRTDAQSLYWSSLNAAFKRQGRWVRRGLNYPSSLTTAIVDSVAADWEPKILERIRAQIQDLARRDAQLVERLFQAASEADPSQAFVSSAEKDAQRRLMLEAAKSCVTWSEDQLEALRDRIQASLHERVLDIIGGACDRAIEDGRNRGKGAKNRIIEDFHEAGIEAIEEAEGMVVQALSNEYNAFVHELQHGYLAEHHDPLDNALESLLGDATVRARHEEATRRKQIRGDLVRTAAELSALIEPTPGGGGAS